MQYSRVLITGASGFIGSRLCEKFKLQYGVPYRAGVRRFDRAARIARLGSEMVGLDFANPASLDAAVKDCDAIVHLAFVPRSNAEANLIAAAKRGRVKRFVHISSMAVHGPAPGPECAREETAVIKHYHEPYSDAKARAEKIVQRAIGQGLPAVILRPTIVYGPYSPFITRIIEAARAGAVSLIDEGAGTCNAVYVDDVCDAIHAALESDSALGQAMFVNADHAVAWKDFNLTFANMVTPAPAIGNFRAQDVRAHWNSVKPSFGSNCRDLLRLIASSKFQEQLETVPFMKFTIRRSKFYLKKWLPETIVLSLASAGAANAAPNPSGSQAWPDLGRCVREDFHIEFVNGLAKRVMNWKPAFDFAAGAALTRTWLEFTGMLQA